MFAVTLHRGYSNNKKRLAPFVVHASAGADTAPTAD
jgi:hypothetical protein